MLTTTSLINISIVVLLNINIHPQYIRYNLTTLEGGRFLSAVPGFKLRHASLAPKFLGPQKLPLYIFHPKVFRPENCPSHPTILHLKISGSKSNTTENVFSRSLTASSANGTIAFWAESVLDQFCKTKLFLRAD